MNLYFRKYSVKLTLSNKQQLLDWLEKNVERTNGKRKYNAPFIGSYDSSKFKISKKFFHYNSFRPQIIGEFSNNHLRLSLGLPNFAFVFFGIGQLMFLYSYLKTYSHNFLIGSLIWTLFWYPTGWLFFSLDFKKSKAGFDEIIQIVNGELPAS